jgi:hypothetical protein
VRELEGYSNIKMIAPGIIDAKRSGKRHITAVYTSAGIHFIVSGTGVQKIAVHLRDVTKGPELVTSLKNAKALRQFAWGERNKIL